MSIIRTTRSLAYRTCVLCHLSGLVDQLSIRGWPLFKARHVLHIPFQCPRKNCLRLHASSSNLPSRLPSWDAACAAVISGIVYRTRFGSAATLTWTLHNDVTIDSCSNLRRALEHKTPIEVLQKWQEKLPELSRERVYSEPGLDLYPIVRIARTSPRRLVTLSLR